MFYFRLDRIFIKDNGVNRWINKLDKANIHIYSFITSGNNPLPALKNFTAAKNEEERMAIIKSAVGEVIASRVLTPIENIKDDHELIFGDTGMVLYTDTKIPDDFNWQMVVIGSKEKARTNAQMLKDVLEHESFDGFAKNILLLTKASTNPLSFIGVEIGKYLATFILNVYANKSDDQLGIVYQSWNRLEHYPHGKRFKDGVMDLTKNMSYDYSMFAFTKIQAIEI
jgi:hypothetical protein